MELSMRTTDPNTPTDQLVSRLIRQALDRRRFLAGLGGSALALQLSACGSDGSSPTPAPAPAPPPPPPTGGTGGGGTGGGGGTSQPGYIGSVRPYTWLSPAYQAQLAANLAAATPAASRFKQEVDEVVASPGSWYGIHAWWMGMLYRVLNDSKYGNFAVNSTQVPSLTNYYVGGVDRFIDGENSRTNAYNGSGTLPEWARDDFYPTRDAYPLVALVYDFCYPVLTAAQRSKWIDYYNRGLTELWSATPHVNGVALPNASYALMNQFSGIDPADNYFYGHMLATMLGYTAFGADNPQALDWRAKFRDTLCTQHLFPYLNALAGGGSPEGTGYGAALYLASWCLDMWEKSTGEDLYALCGSYWPDTISWWCHMVVPTLDFVCPYGDQSRDSTAALYDTHRTTLTSLIRKYPAATNARAALALLNASSVAQDTYSGSLAFDFAYDTHSSTAGTLTDLGRYWKADGSGYLNMRSGWARTDTLLSVSYGRLTESHDHYDKGAFLLYRNSWLAYDQVINTASGIEGGVSTSAGHGTDYHNLVAVLDGTTPQDQRYPAPASATINHWEPNSNGYWYFSIDTAAAWGAPVVTSLREFVWFEPDVLVIFDHLVTSAARTLRWQMNTPYVPVVAGSTATFTGTGATACKLSVVEPAGATVAISDWSGMTSNVQNYIGRGRRIDVSQSGTDVSFLTVIDLGGTLVSALATGLHQVTLAYSSGQQKVVTFSTTGAHVSVA
jgi:hypothetical protein